MEELNVKLGADGRELTPELKKAAEQFKDYGRSVSASLANVAGQVAKGGQSAKAAGLQFQGFGRFLQDAAYGPNAVANQVEQLTYDIRQLIIVSRESGQSIGKTLVQSLAGGGGLNLAIGATTLALSLASVGLSAWTRLFPKNADEVDKTKKKTQEYIDTIGDLRKAQLLGTQNAQQELTNLRLLFAQYQNINLPLKQRKDAYKQLQEQYPGYFKNIKFEQTQSAKTKISYDQLTSSILATARARAATELIAQNQGRKLQDEQKIIDLQKEQAKNQANLAILEKRRETASGSAGVGSAGGVGIARDIAAVEAKINENLTKQRALATDILTLDKNNLQLEKSVNVEIAKGAQLTGDVGAEVDKVTAKTKKAKGATEEWLNVMFAKVRDKAVAGLDTTALLPSVDNASKIIAQQQAKNLREGIERNRMLLQQSSMAYNEFLTSITNNMANAFANLFTGILTEGKLSFKALGNAILQEFARVLGSAIVKKLAGLFLNFATGGGAGIFGSIFKFLGGGAGRIPGFANGVENFSGGLAYVHKGEVLTNLAPGTSVIPANVVSGMGAGGGQVFIANSYQRADMIVTTYERGERQLGRVI